jgi:hypothetical protein
MSRRPTEIDSEQQRVADLLSSFDAPAPESLHRRVEALVASHESPARRARRERTERADHGSAARASRRRPFFAWGFAAAGVTAIAVVAVALGLAFSGGSHTLSLRQAAAPTLRAATLPAPAESRADHAQLTAAVGGVRFPYWGERFGWHSTGTRSDRVDGRAVTTVFYVNASGERIGYAILAGTPAPRISGGKVAWHGDVPYRVFSENGTAVVTWQRDGHLCVMSGHGVSSATLLKLADSSDREASTS